MSYEQERLAKLKSLSLLDTKPETAFDDVVKIASAICGTPIAFMSLLDEKRQWFKSCVGLAIKSSPREFAFCDHTIRSRELMIVNDAAEDSRFKENPLVTGLPGVRFYAGFPLWTKDGYCIGSLCALDLQPRELGEKQIEAMKALARQLMAMVETRTSLAEFQLDQIQAKNARENLAELTRQLPVAFYMVDQTGKCVFQNEACWTLSGLDRDKPLGYGYMAMLIEEDRMEIFETVREARSTNSAFQARGRVRRADGRLRHVQVYSTPMRNGHRVGTVIDISELMERIEKLELQLSSPVLKKAE